MKTEISTRGVLRPGDEIIFRFLGKDVPRNWARHGRAQAEYYENGGGQGFPAGIAWLMMTDQDCPILDYVLVADDCRRRGIASALVRACRARWPGLKLSYPTNAAGEALYRKTARPRTPEEVFNQDALKRMLNDHSREEVEAMAREFDEGGITMHRRSGFDTASES